MLMSFAVVTFQDSFKGAENFELKEAIFRESASPLLSIAKRHEGYQTLWCICYDLNDTAFLRNLMVCFMILIIYLIFLIIPLQNISVHFIPLAKVFSFKESNSESTINISCYKFLYIFLQTLVILSTNLKVFNLTCCQVLPYCLISCDLIFFTSS